MSGTSASAVQRVEYMMASAIDNAMSSLLVDLQTEANRAALREYLSIPYCTVTLHNRPSLMCTRIWRVVSLVCHVINDSKSRPATHCMVLPPGEVNGIIPESLHVSCGSLTTAARAVLA